MLYEYEFICGHVTLNRIIVLVLTKYSFTNLNKFSYAYIFYSCGIFSHDVFLISSEIVYEIVWIQNYVTLHNVLLRSRNRDSVDQDMIFHIL